MRITKLKVFLSALTGPVRSAYLQILIRLIQRRYYVIFNKWEALFHAVKVLMSVALVRKMIVDPKASVPRRWNSSSFDRIVWNKLAFRKAINTSGCWAVYVASQGKVHADQQSIVPFFTCPHRSSLEGGWTTHMALEVGSSDSRPTSTSEVPPDGSVS